MRCSVKLPYICSRTVNVEKQKEGGSSLLMILGLGAAVFCLPFCICCLIIYLCRKIASRRKTDDVTVLPMSDTNNSTLNSYISNP